MIHMTLSEVATLLGCDITSKDIIFQGISHDTRTIVSGNLFIALVGERIDGHRFMEEAMKRGATAAIVSQKSSLPIPQLLVHDTLEAFGKISQIWRERFHLPVIAVTGSNGKTTLKNMIASILVAACQHDESRVLATEGNLNNHIGVPMMLSRLHANHRYAVIEMGMNHFNEIAYLTRLTHPTVAVINNAHAAHLEGVTDVAGVARAKGEIFLGLQKNGIAILNRDDVFYDYWCGLIPSYPKITFGLQKPADVTATILENQRILLQVSQEAVEVTLPFLGRHNVMNALAATAATLAVSIDLPTIKKGLESAYPAPGRLRQYFLNNGARMIDDTYNANPFSLEAAIDTLMGFSGTRIMVLGDMKELGATEVKLHYMAGEKIRSAGIQYLLTLGELSRATTEAFGHNAQHFVEHDKLIVALRSLLKSDVTILIKGSRSMQMEKIVANLLPSDELKAVH